MIVKIILNQKDIENIVEFNKILPAVEIRIDTQFLNVSIGEPTNEEP
jgi:hypothetical protein